MEQEQFVDSNGKVHFLQLRFHRESRLVYRVDSLEDLTKENYQLLKLLIDHHATRQVPRLRELMDYGMGINHTVLDGLRRRREEDASDTRVAHNFCGNISLFKQGYIVGNPIQIAYADEKTDDVLHSVDKDNEVDGLNRDLVKDLSELGRAHDIVYRTKEDKTKLRRLDPLDTFVIYDRTLSQHSIAAVRYYHRSLFSDDEKTVELWTDTHVIHFHYDGKQLVEESVEPHYFEQIPITEYANNNNRVSDYEPVLALVDLYDSAQSDTGNLMRDLSDAILLVTGRINFPASWSEEEKVDFIKTMRNLRFMLLQPPVDAEGKQAGNVDAKYLIRSYDVQGSEAYKQRIADDIHQLTNIPNLNDVHFSGTQSGESMKYKLFGLEQERSTLESLFTKGLKRRYGLITTIENKAGHTEPYEPQKLSVIFTPNKTLNELDQVNMVKNLYGLVSEQTLLESVKDVTKIDPQTEKERLQREKEDSQSMPRLSPTEEMSSVGDGDGEN
ncbi:MAG: phage portal protein [Aerococcus sp.]|nr:phage portal protein [Aerococcus sp.]